MDSPKNSITKKEKYVPPPRSLEDAKPVVTRPSSLRKAGDKLCPRCAGPDHVYVKCQSTLGKSMKET